MNRDNFIFGTILGLIIPILGVFLFYVVKYMPSNTSINDFIFMLKTNHYLIPKVLSLGLIACIPLITYYKNRRLYTTLKGIFVAIIFYAIVSVLYKFNLL